MGGTLRDNRSNRQSRDGSTDSPPQGRGFDLPHPRGCGSLPWGGASPGCSSPSPRVVRSPGGARDESGAWQVHVRPVEQSAGGGRAAVASATAAGFRSAASARVRVPTLGWGGAGVQQCIPWGRPLPGWSAGRVRGVAGPRPSGGAVHRERQPYPPPQRRSGQVSHPQGCGSLPWGGAAQGCSSPSPGVVRSPGGAQGGSGAWQVHVRPVEQSIGGSRTLRRRDGVVRFRIRKGAGPYLGVGRRRGAAVHPVAVPVQGGRQDLVRGRAGPGTVGGGSAGRDGSIPPPARGGTRFPQVQGRPRGGKLSPGWRPHRPGKEAQIFSRKGESDEACERFRWLGTRRRRGHSRGGNVWSLPSRMNSTAGQGGLVWRCESTTTFMR